MKHYLLIEGANYNHINLGKSIDISIICLKDTLKKLDKQIYNQIFIVNNLWDIGELEQYQIERFNFDFVYSFSEHNQIYAGRISDYYHIPGYSEEKVKFLNSKLKVRQLLKLNNLSDVESRIVGNLEEAMSFVHKFGYPIVAKPNVGIGGINVKKISSEEELYQMKFDNNYLFEEFIVGKEFSVESFTFNNETTVLAITEKIKDSYMNEVGHIIPAKLPKHIYESIERYVINVNKALGIFNSVNHTEVILKQDNSIEIVETHFRMGGGMIGRLLQNTFGKNVVDCWGESIKLDYSVTTIPQWNGNYSAVYFKFSSRSGIINEILLPSDEDKLNITLLKQRGYKVDITGNNNRVAYMIFTDSSYEAVKKLANKLEKIKIEVK